MFAGRRAPLVTAALGVRYGRRKPNPLVTRRVFRVSAGRLGFMYSSAPPAPLYGHYDPYTDASVVGHDALGAPIWAPWSGVGMAVLVGVPHTMATAAVHLLCHGMVGWSTVICGRARDDESAELGLKFPPLPPKKLLPRSVQGYGAVSGYTRGGNDPVMMMLAVSFASHGADMGLLTVLSAADVDEIPHALRGRVALVEVTLSSVAARC